MAQVGCEWLRCVIGHGGVKDRIMIRVRVRVISRVWVGARARLMVRVRVSVRLNAEEAECVEDS